MGKIDSSIICNYCVEYHGANVCDGIKCKKMTKLYLKDKERSEYNQRAAYNKGRTEEGTDMKIFKRLCIGDEIYLLLHAPAIPEIRKYKISSLLKMDNNCLRIGYESSYIDIVPFKKMHSDNFYDSFFLNEKDCREKLKKICADRIARLSEAIERFR